ncbi:hypothetical protein BLA13014_03714 [Burkholderia aenigmatica]|uniref:Uncharacterized protein n=1 Tax=Burkholderia aenigmatica TaxID=2015348 RepID=A0A6P2MFU6_9BURK|nr:MULTISPECIES: hypothetical protein [Burkholderia]VWB80768.1 hypothetical protein BLA13014_03714 [Burkholderia aenigmatica]
MKSWHDVLIAADPLVRFLEQDAFFGAAYRGDPVAHHVVRDAAIARHFATDDSFDDFDEWESVSDAEEVFPAGFEWSRQVASRLMKNQHWGIEGKHFNGADLKWTNAVSCPLIELMIRDIGILFQCYANDCFPPIWDSILRAYLDGGFPCGWDGRHPAGRLVVFSNA